MTLKTKEIKTMEHENGYGHGHYYGHGLSSIEKSIGDAKSQLLMQLGNVEGRVSDVVSSGHSRLADVISSGHSSILREVGGSKCDILTKIGDSECSLTKEINDSESVLTDRMGSIALDNFKNQSDIAQRQSMALTAMERDLQNRLHETRFLLSKDIADRTERVSDKSDGQFANLKDQLRYLETSMGKQFCNLETEGLKNTTKILETLAANKYDALKDEVDSIRADRYADRYGYNFALQNQELAYLKNMINSVEQTQKFGSKTVQFGTGNTAGTAQTANQG